MNKMNEELVKITPIVQLPEGFKVSEFSDEQRATFQELKEVEVKEETANYLISLNYARKCEGV